MLSRRKGFAIKMAGQEHIIVGASMITLKLLEELAQRIAEAPEELKRMNEAIQQGAVETSPVSIWVFD